MANQNFQLLELAAAIGDCRRGVSVVGKSQEETVANLAKLFEKKEKNETNSRKKVHHQSFN